MIKLTPPSLGLSPGYRQCNCWVSREGPFNSKFIRVVVSRIQFFMGSCTEEFLNREHEFLTGYWLEASLSYLPLEPFPGAAHHAATGFIRMSKLEQEMVSSRGKSQSFVT